MNRLQKKCLFASCALHALLGVTLLVGPGFLSRKPEPLPDLPLLDVIPSKLVDELFSGGGQPQPQPPPAPPPRQPEPRIEPPKPKPKPEPRRKPDTPAPALKEPAPKPKVKVSPEVKPIERRATPRPTDADRVSRAAEAELARRLQETRSRLKTQLSTSTSISPLGPGGEAYANYAQAVRSIYDQAWIEPEGYTDESATVQVEVTVAREGAVLSDPIVRRSGSVTLDASVQAALNRVRARGLPRFPDGAKEDRRTFIINFNLKSRRLLG